MPFYSVEHSYPLTTQQKTQLASAITRLHSTKFLTPSIFVHVNFKSSDATHGNYFIAGKARVDSTNRIVGMVRTSESRTQQHWQEMAHALEEAWFDAVNGEIIEEGKDQGKRKNALNDTQTITDAKRLRLVVFYPMIAIRENGDAIPQAGVEAQWLQEHREEFQKKADNGDELYKEMLEEVTTREDLKKAYGA